MDMPDFGPQQPAGCKGKIDFLFVVSSEGTMKTSQEKLLAAFPASWTLLRALVPPEFDFQILSANTDELGHR